MISSVDGTGSQKEQQDERWKSLELRVSAVERKRTPDSGRELSDFATFLVTGYSSLHLVLVGEGTRC
jgi:hypothetical protein